MGRVMRKVGALMAALVVFVMLTPVAYTVLMALNSLVFGIFDGTLFEQPSPGGIVIIIFSVTATVAAGWSATSWVCERLRVEGMGELPGRAGPGMALFVVFVLAALGTYTIRAVGNEFFGIGLRIPPSRVAVVAALSAVLLAVSAGGSEAAKL